MKLSALFVTAACLILAVQSTRYDEEELNEPLPVQLVLTAASGPSAGADRQRLSSTYDDYYPQFRKAFRPSGANAIPQDRAFFGTNWFSNPQTGQTGQPGPPGPAGPPGRDGAQGPPGPVVTCTPPKSLTTTSTALEGTTATLVCSSPGTSINVVTATFMGTTTYTTGAVLPTGVTPGPPINSIIPCGMSVTDPVNNACMGRTTCTVSATFAVLTRGVDPCPGLGKQLIIYYTCSS